LYVISGAGEESLVRRKVREKRVITWMPELWAVLTVAACTIIDWPLLHRLSASNLIMIYLFGVSLVAYHWGRGAALTASVLSVLSFDFFFVPPYLSFAIADNQYYLTLTLMLAAGVLISTLTGRLRLQNLAALERESRTRALYRLSRELSETPEPHQLV